MSVGHCIVNGCADVFYQEYLPPSVRWQYGSEPWQEIIGADNYSSQSSYNLSANQRYKYVAASALVQNGAFQGWGQQYPSSTSYQFNGIQDWYVVFNKMYRQKDGSAGYAVKYGYPPNDTFDNYGNALPPSGFRSIVPTIWVLSQGVWSSIQVPSTFGWIMYRWEPANLANATTQCQFKVFKKGQVVHSETRAVCPQVEVIPLRLDPRIQRIEISKLPFLQTVLINPAPNIPECLNIYNLDTISQADSFDPNALNAVQFVQQICSYPGTPPPEYNVTCGCKCIKCPPNTCAITCGDTVCCYDHDGRAVLTIPLVDACEDMICDC